jgi:hypothetical protein
VALLAGDGQPRQAGGSGLLALVPRSDLISPTGLSANPPRITTIDLDVDIGADAVDYNAIANQESLSGLETEMRKLEAVATEIVNEMDYLKKREGKMRNTNRESV